MLTFVLIRAAAVVLFHATVFAMLAVLLVAFLIAGPFDHDGAAWD